MQGDDWRCNLPTYNNLTSLHTSNLPISTATALYKKKGKEVTLRDSYA